jgi:hypothetical protein
VHATPVEQALADTLATYHHQASTAPSKKHSEADVPTHRDV